MAKEPLRTLTIEFLEDTASGLRSVTQSNWSVECLISSRSALPKTLASEASRTALDVPGVYLLVGPPERADDDSQKDARLYVGQADSAADRLDSHLRAEGKKWWRTVVVIRRAGKSPLNLSQCKFLESRFYGLASQAGACVLTNKNAPQPAHLSPSEVSATEEFLGKALVIVNALGLNFFDVQPPAETKQPVGQVDASPPEVPPNLRTLLDAVRQVVTAPSFARSEWYWTHTPDYRAKVVSDGDFRVFVRITWAKNWLTLKLGKLGEQGKFKVSSSADLEKVRPTIQRAYENAVKYLERGR